jgi:hypothetical protein
MATTRGCNAVVKINDGAADQVVGFATSWTLTETAENNEKKYLGSCDPIVLSSGVTRTLAWEGDYDPADVGQVEQVIDTTKTVQVYPAGDAAPATDPLFEGQFFIESVEQSGAADDDTVTFSISSKQNGTFAKTNTW